MPARPARIAASLLACAAGLVAADGLGAGSYSWDELQAGRDIHEGIYNNLSSGEFDEWRFSLGLAPAIDRIQLKTTINGSPYPGPVATETDRTFSNPAMASTAELGWILGDFDSADQGWFYGLGVNYSQRTYHILYAVGTESPALNVYQFGVSAEAGYMWYLNRDWRIEFAPRAGGGILFNQMDSVNLTNGMAASRIGTGAWVELGARGALTWHPTHSQAWHVGAGIDYRYGYGQVIFKDSGPLGDMRSEARLFWFGFGYSLFYGHRF